jgi:RAQPRD family integrative conjugative element protein
MKIIKIKKKTIIKLLLVLSVSVGLQNAFADTENEQALLAQIIQRLDALTPLINQAQSQASTNTRLIFNYDALRADLAKIKEGINQPLSANALEPRPITPISGDYVSLRGQK